MPVQSAGTPRVLVTDAMPVNGGDEALLEALLRGLRRRWPSVQTTVLCRKVEQSRTLLPSLRIEPALGEQADERCVERLYHDADLVISTPGGFLNGHYDIANTLRGFELATRAGKPLVLFGQSIGPFATTAERTAVSRALAGANLITVRDSISLQYLAECGIPAERTRLISDVALLWRRLVPSLFVAKSGAPRRAALCVRRWPWNDKGDETQRTIAKARHLVGHLTSKGLDEFLFISTCQGLPGYIDDSDLAMRVVEGLPASLQDRCTVDRRRYHPVELMKRLSTYDVMFSMRLHGCLLAMLAGTPAMGLAYESKTPEIFRQLGLKKYQVPFTAFQTRWCACASDLLDDLETVRATLPAALDRAADKVWRGFGQLAQFIR